MSFLDKIRKSVPEIREQVEREFDEKDAGSIEEAFDIFSGNSSRMRMKASEYLKAVKGWIYGCVGVISDEVAMIELKLCQMNKAGEVVEVDNHDALDVLYRPNNAMTRFDFINLTFQYLELTGEAPWFVKYEGSRVSGLILLRPDRLTTIPGKNGELIGGYKYRVYGETGMQEITLDPEEVIPLKYADPDNPTRGKGPLQAAATTIDLDDYSERWNTQFFRNSGSPNAVLQTDKKLGKEARARIERRLKEKWSGVSNAHKTMILESGLKWEKISLSQKDMDFVEQQRFSRDKIMAIFRVPKTALGLTEDVNRANAEATDYVFAKRTISPKMKRFTEQLDIFYLQLFPGTENMYFDYKNPVPENVDQDIQRAQTGVQSGYMTINEAREIMDLDPIDGGDVLRDPTSFNPVQNSNGQNLSYKKPKRKAGSYMKHLKHARTSKDDRKKREATVIMETVKNTIVPILYDHLKRNRKREGKVDMFAKALKKSVFSSGTFEELKAAKYDFQEKQLAVADEYEADMVSRMNGVFNAQRDIVIRAVESGDKDVELNPDTETERYQDAFRPVLVPMMKAQASLSFTLLGVQKDFFASEKAAAQTFTQRLISYFDDRTLDLSPGITEETNAKLTAAFAAAAEAEESIPQIKRRISTLFEDMKGYRSQRIARTETIRGSNFATQEAYVESGVVEAKEWLATRDERTDQDCIDKDGTVIPLSGSFQSKADNGYERVEFPPLHVNCRCTLIPVISTPIREGQWRPSMNAAQADDFISESLTKKTYYHGTSDKAASEIMKNGFNLSNHNIGEGVYMTGVKKDASNYADAIAKGDGTTMALKVRAKTMKTFATTGDFVDAVEAAHGNLNDASATAYLKQFDAVEIKDLGYVIVPDPKNVVAIRPN